LVVIGIIAVLIGILLPALAKARRSAATVQCGSNMRQISMAMLMYINASKGVLPPSGVPVVPTIYPLGWWWPNELVRGKYINAPSVYDRPNANVNNKRFNSSNVFRCPEGINEDDTSTSFTQDFPTDAGNNAYTILNDAQCAQDGLGIPSWYQLNTRVGNNGQTANPLGDMALPGGKRAAPFVWFNSGTTANPSILQHPGLQRKISLVRRSAELIMLVEAANPNFYDQASSTRYPGLYMRRLGARHGRKSANGANAYTQFAFFDGHVGHFPTADYNVGPAGNEQWPADKFTNTTIFWVQRQKG
jgi:type II secretory pathway pseudopilin PulG